MDLDIRNVMIVEDDPLLSIVEEKMVTKLGYNVVCKARSGEEALTEFKEHNPSIVLMDIQLFGDMCGIETAIQIQNTHPETPIIFLSGDDNSEVLEKASKVDYVEFLLKPVSKADLSESLSKAENKINQSFHAA